MTPSGRPIPYPASEAWLPDGRIEPVSCARYPGKWLMLFFLAARLHFHLPGRNPCMLQPQP